MRQCWYCESDGLQFSKRELETIKERPRDGVNRGTFVEEEGDFLDEVRNPVTVLPVAVAPLRATTCPSSNFTATSTLSVPAEWWLLCLRVSHTYDLVQHYNVSRP